MCSFRFSGLVNKLMLGTQILIRISWRLGVLLLFWTISALWGRAIAFMAHFRIAIEVCFDSAAPFPLVGTFDNMAYPSREQHGTTCSIIRDLLSMMFCLIISPQKFMTMFTIYSIMIHMIHSCREVTFDHENKTMGMTYQKDSSDDASQCDDVRQLSGGERSYATLAMLLALGKENECPFR